MTGARLLSHKRIALGWGRIWSVLSAWTCAAPWGKIISRVSFRSLAISALFTKKRQWRFWVQRSQDAPLSKKTRPWNWRLSHCDLTKSPLNCGFINSSALLCVSQRQRPESQQGNRRPKARTEEWHYLHTRSWTLLNFMSFIMEISKITQRAKVCYVSIRTWI